MSASDPLWRRASDWLAHRHHEPDLVVIGVPTSVGSLTPSEAWAAPKAVREALDRYSCYDGEAGVDLTDLRVADWGDWLVSHLDATEAVALIRQAAQALPTRPVYAFLGGDNLIAHPLVAGLPHASLERTGLLTFDAHHDVRVPPGAPSNGSPVRMLVEEGLRGDHVVQVGIHTFANSEPYRRYCDERGIRSATMALVDRHGIDRVVGDALGYLTEDCDAIYVDVDLDVLDRAFAPACPGSRPGGMTPRQLARGVNACGRHPKVVAADFVEVDPTRDVADLTVLNATSMLLAFASGVAARLTPPPDPAPADDQGP